MEIRDARDDEAGALVELQRRASLVWKEYRGQLLAHPDAIALPDGAIANGQVRVAVDETGRTLGFSVVAPAGDGAWELDGLFVEPDGWHRGVGRALVADLMARARDLGARSVQVTANPRALGFYERVGFRREGEVATRFGPGQRMRLDLGSSP